MLALALLLVSSAPSAAAPDLPARIARIVLHTLGGPFYGNPAMRFVFLTPPQTFALWARPRFGAHWIVWTDGALWPRHARAGEPASAVPPVEEPLALAWRERLCREAEPVYAHVQGANQDSVGIEVAHSGRSHDPFPPAQVKTVAWLVRSLIAISEGRVSEARVTGHKDLDQRPAYVLDDCGSPRCAFYVDPAGRPYRRRVDPPEGLFAALAAEGLRIPRPSGGGDAELERAEAIETGKVPEVREP